MKIINLSYLETMFEGDKKAIKDIIEVFKSQVPELIQEMNYALKNKDWKALSEIAHKSKSSVAIMGINELADDLKTLELLAKQQKDTEKYPQIVEKFENICNEAVKELEI